MEKRIKIYNPIKDWKFITNLEMNQISLSMFDIESLGVASSLLANMPNHFLWHKSPLHHESPHLEMHHRGWRASSLFLVLSLILFAKTSCIPPNPAWPNRTNPTTRNIAIEWQLVIVEKGWQVCSPPSNRHDYRALAKPSVPCLLACDTY